MKILQTTAFGFVFEMDNTDCYFTKEYEIYINGCFYAKTNKNVVAIFDLKPSTKYEIEAGDTQFFVKTLPVSYLINVADYNGSINMAIYSAPVGSVVYVPAGEYIVDQILLKSHVDIYLAKGAIIKQSTDRERLAIIKGYQKSYNHSRKEINASWEGHPLDCYSSVIYGKNVDNVNIYGQGVIDGNGDIGGFWENPKMKNKAFRPKNIVLAFCRNITITGITSRNSASWNIHPLYCDYIAFRCVKLESEQDSPNTDGINPESCTNVEIVGCHFSVGDDCIALKAGKYYMSVAHQQPTQKIVIRNCFMEKGHGAVVIGSEMSCGVQNIDVSQCLFVNTDRGLRIKTRRGRGPLAIVNNINFTNIQMEGVRHCFVVNMFYFCDPDGKSDYVSNKDIAVADNLTPTIKNITLKNVTATNVTGTAVFIYGLPENIVTGVAIIDCTFTFAKERVVESPAMMDGFEPSQPLDVYTENAEVDWERSICKK
ncbi:MAG: glycoside hydrolase family 28 protein [Defluviitaleaceae bacterium]|nr:glycoside hydrolase family 28 protein [Defluviitaleaceae bacterium]